MIYALRRVFACTRAAAAVEAAFVAPLLLMFTAGITDLGTMTFEQMAVNAAAQAGAYYAYVNSGVVKSMNNTCATLTSACLSNIQTAMDDASGNASFCSTGSACSPSIASCADGSQKCVVVTASYTFSPILPDAAYSWATSLTLSSTVTIRIL